MLTYFRTSNLSKHIRGGKEQESLFFVLDVDLNWIIFSFYLIYNYFYKLLLIWSGKLMKIKKKDFEEIIDLSEFLEYFLILIEIGALIDSVTNS